VTQRDARASAPAARLLLVDDDRAVLEHTAQMVADLGFEPLVAGTWSDALRVFRESKPDLVLLDVMMPTIDGYKLAKMLKAEAARFVPIILVTALDDVESKRRGMAAGADDFLSKPVTALELEIRLSAMLRIQLLTRELQEANTKLAELAVTDALTGLQNRRSLYAQLDREFLRAQRYARPLAVIMIDIDRFKDVNDIHGHQVGDKVLRLVADLVRRTVRAADLTGRFGGEELMVLAPETGRETVGVVAERIRAAVEEGSAAAAPGLPQVTVSVGAATTEDATVANFEELVQAADASMYEAKRAGRNRCIVAG
jgi:diguanylate cyclase (GGDEF)-like protein